MIYWSRWDIYAGKLYQNSENGSFSGGKSHFPAEQNIRRPDRGPILLTGRKREAKSEKRKAENGIRRVFPDMWSNIGFRCDQRGKHPGFPRVVSLNEEGSDMRRFVKWSGWFALALVLVCLLSVAVNALADTSSPNPHAADCKQGKHVYGPREYYIEDWMTCGDSCSWGAVCIYCGAGADGEIILQHQWGSWTVEYPPKDGKPGLLRRQCGRCGKIEYKEYYDDKDEPVRPDKPDENACSLSVDGIVLPEYEKAVYRSGDELVFRLTLHNTGSANVYAPYAALAADGIIVAGKQFPTVTLAPGEDCVFDPDTGALYSYTVTEQDARNGSISFICFGFAGTDSGENVYTGLRTLTFPTQGTPSLGLQVQQISDVKAMYAEGDVIRFAVIPRNMGDVTLYDPIVTVSGKSFAREWYMTGAMVPTDVALFDPDGGYDISFTVTADDVANGVKILSFSASAFTKEGRNDDDEVYSPFVELTFNTAEPAPALLLEVIYDTSAAAVEGVPFEMTMRVTNTGNVPVFGTSIYGGGPLCYYDSYGLGTMLMFGESVEIPYYLVPTAQDAANGKAERTFYAEAKWGEKDIENEYPVVGSNEVDVSVPVISAGPAISLTVDYSPDSLHYEGENRTLLLTVTNTGNVPIEKSTVYYGLFPEAEMDSFNVSPLHTRLMPGESAACEYNLVVSAKDMLVGSADRRFCPAGDWGEPDTENEYRVVYGDDVCISIPVASGGMAAPELIVFPDYYGRSENAIGDKVAFCWYVNNESGVDCYLTDLLWNTDSRNGNLFDALPESEYLLTGIGGGHSDVWFDSLQEEYDENGNIIYHFTAWVTDVNGNRVRTNEVVIPVPVSGYGWTVDSPTAGNIIVEKTVGSVSADPRGYALGETVVYSIRVCNVSDTPMYDIEVSDPMKGSNEDALLGIIPQMDPGQSEEFYYEHVVTQDDVTQTRILNQAFASWVDPVSYERVYAFSPLVVVSVLPVSGPVITKSIDSAPPQYGDDSYYAPGDSVLFVLFVDNFTEETYTDVKVYDPLAPDEFIATFDKLAPHDSKTVEYYYTVSEMDAMNGIIYNTAYLRYTVDGETEWAASNEVSVPAGFRPGDEKQIVDVSLTKEETSRPANGAYYEQGELITYTIRVSNTGKEDIENLIFYDVLDASGAPIAYHTVLSAGEQIGVHYEHTVTEDDINAGKAVNYAWMDYDVGYYGSGVTLTAVSNTVTSRCGNGPDTGTELLLPGGGEDHCERFLLSNQDGVIIYRLCHCAEHGAIETQLEADLAAAATEGEKLAAYDTARAAWTDAINGMYDQYLAAADNTAKGVIIQEKAMFFRYVTLRETELRAEYGGDCVEVRRQINALLENRCADLCLEYSCPDAERMDCAGAALRGDTDEKHGEKCAVKGDPIRNNEVYVKLVCCEDHAGESSRAGRMQQLNAAVNTRYAAADEEGRMLIRASRSAMMDWMNARDALLRLIYSNPGTAVDVMTREVEYFAILECGR